MNAAQALAHYKLFLFDLDGTLITSYMDNADADYHKWEFLRGRIEVLQALRTEGKKVGIVTNQGGLDFAYSTFDDWDHKRRMVIGALGMEKVDVFSCFGHPKGKVHNDMPTSGGLPPEWDPEWRKPSPLMILAAMDHFGAEPGETLYVGDMDTDEEAAKNAGVEYLDHEEFFS